MKVGIAGAGILGRLFALALHKIGWDVTLFDQGGEKSCSRAAAGLLTPLAELEKNDFIIYKLGIEAIQTHWPAIFSELEEDIYFQKNGSLILSHPRDQADLLRFALSIKKKLPDAASIQALDRAQISELEPAITTFNMGYYFPDEAHLDVQAVLTALGNKLNALNCIREAYVEKVSPGKIEFHDRSDYFDLTIDCRGLGAQSIFKDLRGVRGEIIWLYAPEVNISRPIRLIHPRYSLYCVPRPEHCFLIGASEIESNDYSEISVRSTLELLTAAYTIHSGFSEARIIKMVTQCRPTLINHNPKILYSDGFIAVNGLYRHGYLIAPTLVADVVHWLQGGRPAIRYPQLWENILW